MLGVALLLLSFVPAGERGQGPQEILGRWRGRSTCIKAEWNSACNDEEVVYEFVPAGADPSRIMLHAAKIIGGTPEPMYDLAFAYDTATARWDGDFANSRVRIRWSYRVRGDSLQGQVTLLPSGQIGRNVIAWRSRDGS
jgi:hypothetical protein